MGFALPALATLAHPLGAVARWIFPRPAAASPTPSARPAPAVARILVPQPCPGEGPAPAAIQALHQAPPPARPVRVMLRTLEDGSPRIVISGRMADVCAELERLVPSLDPAAAPAP